MFNICCNKKNSIGVIDSIENIISNNSEIMVKQLCIHGTKQFTNDKLKIFYKSLGDNIPQYLKYASIVPHYIFCIEYNLDINAICIKFPIYKFYTRNFTIEKSKFNANYQIYPTYNNKGFELLEIIE